MKKRTLALFFLVTVALKWPLSGEILIQDGAKLSFMGDSITLFGWNSPSGYVRLIVAGLKANGVTVVPIPAGASGHTSRDMLARMDKSILSKTPDWMTLSCGVNDVWHGEKGVDLENYKVNITAMVEQAQKAGIKVMILTSTPIREDPAFELNQKLASYNEFLRSLAKEKHTLLADLNARMHEVIAAGRPTGRVVTDDGAHMNPHGDEVMAEGVLRAFGLDDAQMEKARQAWAEIPDGWAVFLPAYGSSKAKSLSLKLPLTRAQYEKLETIFAARPKTGSLSETLRPLYLKEVKALLKPDGPYDSIDAIVDGGHGEEVMAGLKESFTKKVEGIMQEPVADGP